MIRQTLNGQWRMRDAAKDEWVAASVPGSVYTDLLNAGLIDDPYYRDNDVEALHIAESDYVYERRFDVDKALLEHDRVAIRFFGLDTLADIYVNDAFLAHTDDMHRTYEFDVKGLLKAGENGIRIEFASALNYIREMDKLYPFDTHNTCATRGFPHIRKAHNMFGWDSEPELPDTGIWRDIEIIAWDTARLDTPYIRQNHAANRASVTSEIAVERLSEGELTCRFTLVSPKGKTLTAEKTVEGSSANVEIEVENPLLWWPNGYGEQYLYAAKVELISCGKVIDEWKRDIGIREIYLRRDKDQWGTSFEINVNGVPIFGKGADYIPLDKFLPRETPERLERLFQDCAAVHHTIMRIWGGAIFPSDTFFDLADKYGIMIWQDFLFACALYRQTPEFEENVICETRDNIKRLRHHASLALWCGDNENEWLMDEWKHDKTPKKRLDYIRLSEVILNDVAAKYDPDRLYFPSSPSSDGFFHEPNGGNMGDIHCWDIWHNAIKPYEKYEEYPSRFTSEFGLQSFPCMKTVEEFTLPEDRFVGSYVLDHHQRNGNGYGNAQIMYYVLQDLPYPQTMEKVVYASQVVQSECVRYGAEFWRRIRPRCMGVIYWQVGDCWQAPTWASIDYAGRWKALHYRSAHFYAPTLLSIAKNGEKLDLYAVSDQMVDKTYTLAWAVRNAKGEAVKSGSQSVISPKLSSALLSSFDAAELTQGLGERDVYFEAKLLDGETVVSANNYMFVKPKHFRFEDPKLEGFVEETADGFEIHIKAAAFARYVYIDFDGFDCPTDDNFFDMNAGEKVVKIKRRDNNADAKELTKALRLMSVWDLFR